MGRGKSGKGSNKNPKRKALAHADDSDDDMMNDDIDTFHKQRDIIPLDVNDDSDDSDDETDLPVFDSKDDEDDEDDDEEDDEDDSQLTGLAAKIARQQKYLRAKVGGVEDEMHDDDEDAEEKETVWGRGKERYYGGENVDYEIQSSDEELHDEEEEVLRLQREKVKSLSAEDYGLEHVSEDDESEKEQTMEEILVGGVQAKAKGLKEKVGYDDVNTTFKEVKKDLNTLSKEEKMDVVYSSAPELVGLLSELNSSLDELDNKVNPLLSKVSIGQNGENGSMNYIELKRLLLLTYCQSITFYLLLKAEGESARDHPVISRIVELKELLDKTKQLDSYLPNVEDILNKKEHIKETVKLPALMSNGLVKDLLVTKEQPETIVMPKDALNVECTKDHGNKQKKRKHQDDQLPAQSLEMLKVRAALEEKLKHKGVMNTIKKKDDKTDRRLPLLNRKFETLDDFDDDTVDPSLRPSKLSKLVTAQVSKPKMISGDDDLPKRDDIGERRRKHELRVLANAGIDTGNDKIEDLENGGGFDQAEDDESSDMESEDEFYKQVKQQRDAKLAAKSEKYSRKPAVPIKEEEEVEGGIRRISYQMEKNRGLTRPRKKLIKNPRKKYKLKHQKAVERRKGQVRDIRKQTGSYGGETTGINPGISRSVRF